MLASLQPKTPKIVFGKDICHQENRQPPILGEKKMRKQVEQA